MLFLYYSILDYTRKNPKVKIDIKICMVIFNISGVRKSLRTSLLGNVINFLVGKCRFMKLAIFMFDIVSVVMTRFSVICSIVL